MFVGGRFYQWLLPEAALENSRNACPDFRGRCSEANGSHGWIPPLGPRPDERLPSRETAGKATLLTRAETVSSHPADGGTSCSPLVRIKRRL